MKKKTTIIWTVIVLMVLVSIAGCTGHSDVSESDDVMTIDPIEPIEPPSDPEPLKPMDRKYTQEELNAAFEVVKAFFAAYNNKDESGMLELATADMGKDIKEQDWINNGIGRLKNYQLKSVHFFDYQDCYEDRIHVYCKWDDKLIEEAKQAGSQNFCFTYVVKENGLWKVGGFSTSP